MSCKLYVNIGIGHENSYSVLEQRVIAAAQCNADAVIVNKSTPHLIIPEEKRYVAIPSKWGTLPYIEVAKKSEVSHDTAQQLTDLCNTIGIQLIWSVTDSMAAEFVREFSSNTVKLHHDAVDVYELSRYCKENFEHVMYSIAHSSFITDIYKRSERKNHSIYYATDNFPPEEDELCFNVMDRFLRDGYTVGYESREPGIFPAIALVYKGLDYIEKYMTEESDNPSIITPEQLNDMFNSMLILENANSGNA